MRWDDREVPAWVKPIALPAVLEQLVEIWCDHLSCGYHPFMGFLAGC